MIFIKLKKLENLYYNLFIIIIRYILVFLKEDISIIILYIFLVNKKKLNLLKKRFY